MEKKEHSIDYLFFFASPPIEICEAVPSKYEQNRRGVLEFFRVNRKHRSDRCTGSQTISTEESSRQLAENRKKKRYNTVLSNLINKYIIYIKLDYITSYYCCRYYYYYYHYYYYMR